MRLIECLLETIRLKKCGRTTSTNFLTIPVRDVKLDDTHPPRDVLYYRGIMKSDLVH